MQSGLDSSSMRPGAVKLGASHGYRFNGDLVSLNAELAVSHDAHDQRGQWALQLWACETPYDGGSLSGIKVAEAPVALSLEPGDQHPALPAATPARVPAGQREYSMVLVLASGSAGAFDQVHDFANYPARERFAVPHFEGAVGYRIEDDMLVVSVERVRNPRSDDNLTGTLALELWALTAPYTGDAIEATGVRLAETQLERIAGQNAQDQVEYAMPFTEPPADRSQLVLMLREWTALGYETRDFCNFAAPYRAAKPVATDELPAASAAAEVAPPRAPIHEAPLLIAAIEPEPAEPEPAKPVLVAAPTPTAAVVEPGPAEPARLSIQRASVDELATVKGLNRKLAGEIVKNRPYTSVDQLLRVRGIGDKLLRKLRESLTL
jgi:DNA uptake protein ComE-like DNA-binding protein